MAYNCGEYLYLDKIEHMQTLPTELSTWHLEHTYNDGGNIKSVDVLDSSSRRLSTFQDNLTFHKKMNILKNIMTNKAVLCESLSEYLHSSNFKGLASLIALLMACFPGKKGRDRKPLLLVDRQSEMPQMFEELLSIEVSREEKCICTVSTKHLKVCSVCGLARLHTDMVRCSVCQVMLYCSKTCADAADMGSHDGICGNLKNLYEKSLELDSHPFTFNSAVTSDSFDAESLSSFLKGEGVYNLGMWVRETPHCSLCDMSLPPYGELDLSLDPYVLPIEGETLELKIAAPVEPLTCWEDYFSWRGFSLSSPISILMHYCMTVYHIIQISKQSHEGSVSVVVAGIDKEADLIPTFVELSSLLPNLKLKLTLVGPLISKYVSNRRTTAFASENLQIYLYSGLVQDVCQPSDLVICMNAGLSAYSTWKYAILKFMEYKLACFVTDFCLLSLESSKQAADNICFQDEHGVDVNVVLEEPIVNPFRSPFRKYSESTNMHWYSNGYICQLHYDSQRQLTQLL